MLIHRCSNERGGILARVSEPGSSDGTGLAACPSRRCFSNGVAASFSQSFSARSSSPENGFEDIRNRAIHFVRDFGWASLAIDAPGHGDRISCEEAAAERLKAQARVRGDADAPSMSPEDKIRYLDTLAAQAVPEWQAALDATLGTEVLGDIEAIAYLGVSMGTWIGVPLLAADTRFRCAVLGLSQLHPDHCEFRKAAERIAIPLRFAFQWDDLIRSRKYGIDLFNTFGSSDKSMHINPGGHAEIPSAESNSWDDFFQRHLNSA